MNEEVKTFIGRMANTQLFDALEDAEKDEVIFTSSEYLKAIYRRGYMTSIVIAFQVLHDLEAQTEHYQHLKRHGVKSFSSKGVSVTFEDGSNVCPEVIGIMGVPSRGAGVGRLI